MFRYLLSWKKRHSRNNSLASSCHHHTLMLGVEVREVYVKQVLYERAPTSTLSVVHSRRCSPDEPLCCLSLFPH